MNLNENKNEYTELNSYTLNSENFSFQQKSMPNVVTQTENHYQVKPFLNLLLRYVIGFSVLFIGLEMIYSLISELLHFDVFEIIRNLILQKNYNNRIVLLILLCLLNWSYYFIFSIFAANIALRDTFLKKRVILKEQKNIFYYLISLIFPFLFWGVIYIIFQKNLILFFLSSIGTVVATLLLKKKIKTTEV